MNPFEIFIAYMAWGSGGKSRPVLAFIVGDSSARSDQSIIARSSSFL
jgi:hypothetical protein